MSKPISHSPGTRQKFAVVFHIFPFFWQTKKKAVRGTPMKKFFKNKYFIYSAGGILSGFFNGLFGSGGGTIVVPFLEEFLDQDEHTSHATAILIILGFTIVSLFFYGFGNYLNWKLALVVSIGGVAGGFLGAKLLKKLKGSVIRKIFGIFMLIAAFKMVKWW